MQPTEVIVIDDGSTDRSIEMIKQSEVDVVLLESEFRNGAGTRNVGIEYSSSKWIAFLDADDYWYPNHLQRAFDLLDGTEDVGYLNWFDSVSAVDSGSPRSRPVMLDINQPMSGLTGERFFENFNRTGWFNMPGCVVHRERLVEVGALDNDQKRRHDIEMWIRLIHGHTWSFDPVASSVYQVDTPGSISRAQSESTYFLAKAFVKNRQKLPAPIGDLLVNRFLRAALWRSVIAGKPKDFQAARKLSSSELKLTDRIFFQLLWYLKPLARLVERVRFVIRNRKRNNSVVDRTPV